MDADTLIEALRAQSGAHGLLRPSEHILVAVSGGADSVALLLGLIELSQPLALTLTVAHLNHGIRANAAADAEFVDALARTQGLNCVLGRAEVPILAARNGVSLEMAARDARYQFLLRTARAQGCTAVATAHTADDQAETVLLRVARGTGTTGLAGIRPLRDCDGIRLLRPLLAVARTDVEAFLRARNQAWREDDTNLDMGYARNRVRHRVLPLLAGELNPRVREALCRLAALTADDEALLDALAREEMGHCVANDRLTVDAWLALQPALRSRVLLGWLQARGIPAARLTREHCDAVEALCGARSGCRAIDVGDGWVVRREYGELAAVAATDGCAAFRVCLTVPGITAIPAIGILVEAVIAPGLVRDRTARVDAYPARASLAWHTALPPILVRSWQPGDRMHPLGIAGTRKLQDIFVDIHVPAPRRARVPIFTCGTQIVWLPGYRIAAGWEVTTPDAPNLQFTVRQSGA